MNRGPSAVAGGVVGTTVMSVMLLLLEVETRSTMELFDVVARFIGLPGDPALGFALFAAAGVVAWPLLFLALERYLPRGPDPAARGVVFGTILWVPFVITGRGDIDGPLLVFFGVYTLFAHWLYGFTLGAVYSRLLESSADRPMPGGTR